MIFTFRVIGFGINADGVLLNPAYQSEKLIAVWTHIEPLPLIVTNPVIVSLLFILLAVVHAFIFAVLYQGIPGEGIRKGVNFGLLVWFLSYGFFEFFTPFNMFREPLPLVLMELFFWLVIALSESLVIYKVYSALSE